MNGINTTILTGFAAAITPIRRPAKPGSPREAAAV
jgi:hypothetical protein